jgi:cell division protein FtsW (lipid II flippase)
LIESRTVARRERILLALGAVFVTLNHLTLILARGESAMGMWPILIWLVCAAAAHIVLSRLLPSHDPYLLPVVMALTGWGLTLVARLAPPFATRQAIWVVIATAAMLVIVALPPDLRILRRYRYTWLLAGLVLLAATLLLGTNPSGDPYAPRLWLGGWGLYFQPSEPLKLLLVVFLASYLAEKREMLIETLRRFSPMPYLGPMLLMWSFCMILLVWQRDLGAAALFFIVFLVMLYLSTGQAEYALAGMVLLLAAGVVGYALFDVVRLRVDAWWNPWPEADARAFQIVQSLLAFAAGGGRGPGVGLGAPTYIPVVHSDFVFAAIAEEWGLLGAIGTVACFALLVMRALHVAIMRLRARFLALLAAGIGTLLGVQALMIMAGVLKLIPLTGVTLPFVSYGGSSLLSSFVMVGLLLRISDPAPHSERRRAVLRSTMAEFSP